MPQKGENFDNIADDYQKFIVPGVWQELVRRMPLS